MLLEPPPKPWTNTKSAIAWSRGSDKVVSPNGPLGHCTSTLSLSLRLAKERERKDRLGVIVLIPWHDKLRSVHSSPHKKELCRNINGCCTKSVVDEDGKLSLIEEGLPEVILLFSLTVRLTWTRELMIGL